MCLSGIDREDEKQTLLSEMEKRNASLADVFVVENDATAPMELISSSLGTICESCKISCLFLLFSSSSLLFCDDLFSRCQRMKIRT